jgi:DNA transposition AAA+ family ATPase
LVYFRDVIGALVEYKRRYEERVKAEFYLTGIGQRVWKQLDAALKTNTMIVIDGLEGRGKTEAVRAWTNCHLGEARFASLDGTSSKTAQVRELARALGVGHGNTRIALEMQTSVKEVLQSSGLMIVVDEAHFLFNQNLRQAGRPEMLDWIDTALCNPPLPIALVTTPQFLECVERAAGQVGWNYRQFQRRCKYVPLPRKNTPEDIEAVARKLLPDADKATIKQVMAYEALSKRDLSAVGDVVREAKLLADEDGAGQVTFEHVKRAIYEVLIPGDVPWAEMEKRLQQKQLGRKPSRRGLALEPEASQESAETRGRHITPRLSPGASSGSRMRFPAADPALISDPDEAILTPV